MKLTAQGRAFAEALLQRAAENDAGEVAKLIAAYREVVISCAVVRMEREFVLKERKR